MAHPFSNLRDNAVAKRRVGGMTKGYATGGAVSSGHGDAAEDLKMIKATVKPGSLKMDAPGKASGGRLDKAPRKPHKAAGGPVGGPSGKKGTNVNIIIAPQGGAAAGGPPTPMLPPPAAGGIGSPSPVPPAGPLMPPPGLGAAGGAPPMPPGAGPMRNGGRAYAKGGSVGGAWEEGLRNGTQVQHTDGKLDGKDIYRPKQVTFAKGGGVGNPQGQAPMGPKMKGGSEGGLARLQKARMQKGK